MMGTLYISTEKLAELRRYCNKVKVFFPEKEQEIFEEFLSGLEKNGSCSVDECNNIYSILNNIHTNKKSEKERKKQKSDNDSQEDDERCLLDILETLRMQFAMKYYFGTAEAKDILRSNQYRNEVLK